MSKATPQRHPAGAARLRPHITDTIIEVVLDELAETGYTRMSMEAVARRAGVGKAAIYRRWASKEALVQEVVARFAWRAAPVPDNGNLREDIAEFLADALLVQSDLRATRIIADLTAEGMRNPQLLETFYRSVREPRRDAGTAMLRRAVERGELPRGLDPDLALDCLIGLVYARPQSLGDSGELTYPYDRHRLLDVIMTALPACRH
ncbi:AcrR family transcriptional regulator [Nocardiopsis arvandica]|uniref:AcrR family transcriptional regulator n=1 Tax=Nocardiopsis sinuspersici TaxID=501010 RepID=A0A7Y9XH63_9ACTN|nr:TetR/AcrR family transcriptional regulator [Nocardiopsis sinuspersici]NYH55598.1 AcrR family transcriptional regulator [Nocardiopsis sinuspersici]